MESLHITAMSHVTPRCRLLHPLPLGYIRSLPSHQTQPWTHRITKKITFPGRRKRERLRKREEQAASRRLPRFRAPRAPRFPLRTRLRKERNEANFGGKSMRVGGRDRDANHQQGALSLGDEKGASEEGQTSTQPLNPRPLGGE